MRRGGLLGFALVGALVLASAATGAATYPVFTPLSSIITNIVGYQIPVVCEPSLAQGATFDVQFTIAYQGNTVTVDRQTSPTTADAAGLTLAWGFLPGSVVTVSVGGSGAVTLPQVPADTPATDEHPSPPYVFVPVAVLLDQPVCNAWNATTDGPLACAGCQTHGTALLVAIHEAMHAKWADGNEALTECRAMQAYPNVLSSLLPTAVDPGAEPVAPSKPARPVPPSKPATWKAKHRTLWNKLVAHYRLALAAYERASSAYQQAYATWQQADATWQLSEAAYQPALTMTNDAREYDGTLPPQYHGATC